MNVFGLTGLKARHPLGFMAACGLLRCLTHEKDFGWTRLGWRIDGSQDTFGVLHSERPLDIAHVTRMLLRAGRKQRESRAWTWSTRIDDRTRYCETAQIAVEGWLDGVAARDAADMLAALASDLVSDKNKLRGTAFDLCSGPQQMLKNLIDVSTGVEQNAESRFGEALTGPWDYQDKDHSLGWDPRTQRLHALRWKAPTNDTANRSVRAAVFLASLALPMFPCFAVGSKLRTVGFHRDGNDDWFAWPVWRQPISLATLRSLISHPFTGDLKRRGVDIVYRCRVTHTGGSQGNYQIFSYPEERVWPRPRGAGQRSRV